MTKAQNILIETRRLAAKATTWADLSNALFDPVEGIVTKTFSIGKERAAFAKTPQYAEIQGLVMAAMKRTGVTDGAAATKSGRFIVRLPVSMHAALEKEAREEGVSLNQLVVAKLAVQLKSYARAGHR